MIFIDCLKFLCRLLVLVFITLVRITDKTEKTGANEKQTESDTTKQQRNTQLSLKAILISISSQIKRLVIAQKREVENRPPMAPRNG